MLLSHFHLRRPQLSIKAILLIACLFYANYCFLLRMPLLSTPLPAYTGPFAVGTLDIEVPCESRTIDPVKLKSTGETVFRLDTVLFTLFYPAEPNVPSKKPKHYWIDRPIRPTAAGYARFAHISNLVTDSLFTWGLWLVAGGTTIPARVDVPFLRQDADKSGSARPVIVFSHGMASSRTDYTQYCGELASKGYVVAAIEHRDGSGPASIVMSTGGEHIRQHITVSDLAHDDDFDVAKLKEVQLDFRQAEVEETIRVLRQINAGDGSEITAANTRKEGDTLRGWTGRLDLDGIVIAGHSYGATLAISTLRGGSSKRLPIVGCIALDPGKHSGPLNHDIQVPIMIIHSDSWSSKHSIFFGRPHFDVVKDLDEGVIKRGKDAWFMTSMGTSHPSVTDAPLIEPMLLSWTTHTTLDVREAVNEYVGATDDFLTFLRSGDKTRLLVQPVSHGEYNKPVADSKQRLDERYASNWQVHVAP